MKKKRLLIVLSTIVAIPILIGVVLHIDRGRELSRVQVYELTRQESGSLRSGDIVMRMGYGMVSALLETSAGGQGVSHCGILRGEGPDFAVIHSISSELSEEDGVQQCSLKEFLAGAKPGSFVAVRSTAAPGEDIVTQAERYLEQRTPFDLAFDLRDTSRIFCSELVYLAILDASGVAIFDPMKPDYNFTSFFDREMFLPVIDHRGRRETTTVLP